MEMHHHSFKIWLLFLVKSEGSLSKAARVAKLTVSAVSQALSQLELVVGSRLLARSERGTKITSAGERLIQIMAPAISLLADFDPELLVDTNQSQRKIRLGAYESIAIDLLPNIISQLRSTWSGINIALRVDRSRLLLELIEDDELDIALVVDPPTRPSIVTKLFAYDSYGLFIHRSVGTGKSLRQLLDQYGMGILKTDDHLHTRSFSRYLKTLDIGSSVALETWSFETILALAKAGSMVGALPLRVAKRSEHDLVRVDRIPSRIDKDSGRHPLAVVCRQDFAKQLFSAILKSLK